MHVISQHLSLRWALDMISLLQLHQASCLTCATQLDTIPHWHIYLIMLQLWNCLMHGFDWSRYVVMLNIYIKWCVYFSFRCSVNSICLLEYLAVKISIDRHKQRIDLTYGLQICSYIYIYMRFTATPFQDFDMFLRYIVIRNLSHTVQIHKHTHMLIILMCRKFRIRDHNFRIFQLLWFHWYSCSINFFISFAIDQC